jgi:hypothetical protein
VSEERGQEAGQSQEIVEVMVVIGRDAAGLNRIEIRGGMHPGMAAALLQQWAIQMLGAFTFNRPKEPLVKPATVVPPAESRRAH